mmetsp:Transcript_21095/g.66702  ORF Transcript_21095/g.66702 Transcript_21095/m.66702 type:complete len:910 (+) Transcript_21095:241-2970(+)
MGDGQQGGVLAVGHDGFEEAVRGLAIQGRRALVQHQHLGPADKGPRGHEELLLAHGEHALHDGRSQGLRQGSLLCHLPCIQAAPLQRCHYLRVRVVLANVLLEAHREDHRLLGDDGDMAAEVADAQGGHVHTVQQYAATAAWRHAQQGPEAQHDAHKRGLAAASLAHNAHLLPRLQGHAHAAERRRRVRHVAEGHGLELQLALAGPVGRRVGAGLGLHEVGAEEVLQLTVLGQQHAEGHVELAEAVDHASQGACQGEERVSLRDCPTCSLHPEYDGHGEDVEHRADAVVEHAEQDVELVGDVVVVGLDHHARVHRLLEQALPPQSTEWHQVVELLHHPSPDQVHGVVVRGAELVVLPIADARDLDVAQQCYDHEHPEAGDVDGRGAGSDEDLQEGHGQRDDAGQGAQVHVHHLAHQGLRVRALAPEEGHAERRQRLVHLYIQGRDQSVAANALQGAGHNPQQREAHVEGREERQVMAVAPARLAILPTPDRGKDSGVLEGLQQANGTDEDAHAPPSPQEGHDDVRDAEARLARGLRVAILLLEAEQADAELLPFLRLQLQGAAGLLACLRGRPVDEVPEALAVAQHVREAHGGVLPILELRNFHLFHGGRLLHDLACGGLTGSLQPCLHLRREVSRQVEGAAESAGNELRLLRRLCHRPVEDDAARVQHQQAVGRGCEALEQLRVHDHDACGAFHGLHYRRIPSSLHDLVVHGGHRVVQERQRGALPDRINGAGQGRPGPLAAGEVAPLLAHFREVALRVERVPGVVHVRRQLRGHQGLPQVRLVALAAGEAEEHVVPDGALEEAGHLRLVGHRARRQPGLALRPGHLPQQRHEQGGLPRAHGPADEREAALEGLHVYAGEERVLQARCIPSSLACGLTFGLFRRLTSRWLGHRPSEAGILELQGPLGD